MVILMVGCYTAFLLMPETCLIHWLALGSGYVSLVLIAITLFLGPLKILRQQRVSMNMNVRRDVGIWAGVSGLVHVLFGFQVHLNGQVWLYFLKADGGVYTPLFTNPAKESPLFQ